MTGSIVDHGFEPTREKIMDAFGPQGLGEIDGKSLFSLDDGEKKSLLNELQKLPPNMLSRWAKAAQVQLRAYPEHAKSIKAKKMFLNRALPKAQNFR